MCAAARRVRLHVGLIISFGGTGSTLLVCTSLGRTNSVPMFLVRWYDVLQT